MWCLVKISVHWNLQNLDFFSLLGCVTSSLGSFSICLQICGIRFLYDNLVESLELFSNSSGFGCILAHSMGLGKTLQVISFIDVLFRHTQTHTVLAIVPVSFCGPLPFDACTMIIKRLGVNVKIWFHLYSVKIIVLSTEPHGIPKMAKEV